MIAKILSPATSFAGINYNERKNEEGRSELLVAKNFVVGIDRLKKSDYIAYMEKVCMTNPSVKNVQFHATISCKGREYSADQLKDIALKYIEKMGYSKNPFIVYFHSDTENNHVHIVSTRVSKEGIRVDDSMERIRSQKAINEIMNIDLKEKVKRDVAKSFQYSFSGVKQYKLLLEGMGWKLSEDSKNIRLSRGGTEQGTISLTQIQQRIGEYNPDANRKKQLAAILHKYKAGLSAIELSSLMKSKFGIELIFHTGKGHVVPYGYTIIDHPGKCIYKGGEILDLKELLSVPDRKAKLDNCNSLIEVILKENDKHSMESLKSSLALYGYRLSMTGDIKLKGESGILLSLDKELLQQLRYNSRLNEANKFNVSSLAEATLLSRIYYVKVEDIILKAEKDSSHNFTMYSDMMKSYLSNSSNMRDALREKNISFVEDKGIFYLIDKEDKVIVSSSSLGIDIKDNMNGTMVSILHTSDIERLREDVCTHPNMSRGHNIIDTLCDIIMVGMHSQGAQQDNRRKRKRGQQQN